MRSLFVYARFAACALVLLLVAGPAVAETETATASALPIKEIRLDNGLRIFVVERTTSPTFAAVYQFDVGGASDPKGRSGIAHLLEHMLFKGTRNIGTLDAAKEAKLMRRLSELWHELHQALDEEEDPFRAGDPDRIRKLKDEIEKVSAEQKKLIIKNEYDEIITRAGGVSLNASTSNDVTTYLVQLPANRLEMWFRLEGDRLLNPVFREFYSERDVVHEERRLRTENSPSGLMYEALQSLMFSAHPYGTPVVGWPRDIERLVREDAMAYFTTYYSPSNCVMVLVGDIRVAEVERLAKKYLARWKRQEIPPRPITSEPEQKGQRRRVVEFDAEPRLAIGWVTVPLGHPDQYALDVLAAILGGLRSSRFDKTIVQEERIAQAAWSSHSAQRSAGYFSAAGNLRGEHTASELESAIEREIKRIQDDGVTADELERAKIRVEVSRVSALKSNLGQAFRIARAVTFTGSTDYIEEYERGINAVTAEQVQAAAKTYLEPSRKSVVELRKTKTEGGPAARGGDVHHRGGTPGERGQKHSEGFGQIMTVIHGASPVTLTVPEIGKDVDRVELPGGTTVFVKEDHSAPSVDMGFAWLGGSNTTPVEQLAPFELASDLLNEGGTAELDPIELEERTEELGMRFNLWVGSTQSGGSFWSLTRNFDESFDLAMSILKTPRLDAKRLAVIKGQYVESMKRRYDSAGYGASLVLSHVRDSEHPRLGYVATKKEIEAITPDQIRAIWKRYLGKDNLYITVVGDFDKKTMLEKIGNAFGSWRDADDARRVWITRDPVLRPGAYLCEKELPQPAVRISHHIKVDRTAPEKDHAALEILNDILGGSGFRSRLMERLRSDEGLTYGIRSYLSHEGRPGVPGAVGVSYQTKKSSVLRSVESVLDEFGKIIEETVSEAEVQEQIEAWRNRFIFRYTNDYFSVSRLMYNELDDRPYDQDRRELEAVQKVTPADVRRVAKKYLAPENLTVAIFGTLTDEDRKALTARYGLEVLPREVVFKGGYDTEPAEEEAPAVVGRVDLR